MNIQEDLKTYFEANPVSNFKNLAKSLLPKKRIGDYNQAVMEFGALQCKPKSPNCRICPINVNCVAFG